MEVKFEHSMSTFSKKFQILRINFHKHPFPWLYFPWTNLKLWNSWRVFVFGVFSALCTNTNHHTSSSGAHRLQNDTYWTSTAKINGWRTTLVRWHGLTWRRRLGGQWPRRQHVQASPPGNTDWFCTDVINTRWGRRFVVSHTQKVTFSLLHRQMFPLLYHNKIPGRSAVQTRRYQRASDWWGDHPAAPQAWKPDCFLVSRKLFYNVMSLSPTLKRVLPQFANVSCTFTVKQM